MVRVGPALGACRYCTGLVALGEHNERPSDELDADWRSARSAKLRFPRCPGDARVGLASII